jgi:hypothetical protein
MTNLIEPSFLKFLEKADFEQSGGGRITLASMKQAYIGKDCMSPECPEILYETKGMYSCRGPSLPIGIPRTQIFAIQKAFDNKGLSSSTDECDKKDRYCF